MADAVLTLAGAAQLSDEELVERILGGDTALVARCEDDRMLSDARRVRTELGERSRTRRAARSRGEAPCGVERDARVARFT